MRRVVIIGGGISGLAAAHRILEESARLRAPVKLELLEAAGQTGGIVKTRERDGFLLELGPDSFISEKPAALDLVNRLGLQPRLIETNQNFRRSFVVRRGRLRPLPDGFGLLAPTRLWPFLASDIFSWPGKARMALDLLLPRSPANGNVDESLAQFVRRRLGREALERLAQPMVGGIYTADPKTLSLKATMPRFLEMERKHRSLILALRKASQSGPGHRAQNAGARYSLFLSFDGGMQVLTDEIAKRISTNSAIRTNTSVVGLALQEEHSRPRWKIEISKNDTMFADVVCLALPSFVSARLLRNVDPRLAAELEQIQYASSATVNLAYKRSDIPHQLDGFGFVVPFIEKRTVMACTFSSVKFAGRAPEHHALLRAFVGGALQPELLERTDEELIEQVRHDLQDFLGVSKPPLFAEVARWKHAMPQYSLGHLDRVRSIKDRAASLPGIALAGNAYTGAGIPDCISSGEDAALALMNRVTAGLSESNESTSGGAGE